MKRTKMEKGITLIALIITIVVLLILASVAISSIQNDGILSYAENVANKYNQSQRNEQSIFDSYLGYLKGEQWATIYEGPGVTENGVLILANEHLFKNGNSYRITLESNEFRGSVETVALLAGTENGSEYYILFGVTGGKEVTANSLTEYMTILQNMPENAVYSIIGGVNISDSLNGNSSAIAVDGTSDCEYKVTKIEAKAEEIEKDNNNKEDLETLKKYALGANNEGKAISTICNGTTFLDDEETTDIDESKVYTFLGTSYSDDIKSIHVYAKYKNKVYNIITNISSSNTEDVVLVYELKGREGTTVAYDSDGDGNDEDWIVLTDRDNTVEIISTQTMGMLTLGSGDTEITGNLLEYLDLDNDGKPDDFDGDGTIEEGGTDLDGDGTIETDDEDIAIASYNNAITIINEYCKSLVTATDNDEVRSVGGTSNYTGDYSSTSFNNFFNGSVSVAAADSLWKEDYYKMLYLGIIGTGTPYWVASRVVEPDMFLFGMEVISAQGGLPSLSAIWDLETDSSVKADSKSNGVRPIIINPEGI